MCGGRIGVVWWECGVCVVAGLGLCGGPMRSEGRRKGEKG